MFDGANLTLNSNVDQVDFRVFHFLDILYAKSGDPDQTPRSAASDLDLHCLPKSYKKDD